MKTLEMMNACEGNSRKFYSPRNECYYQNGKCFDERNYSMVFEVENFIKTDDWEEVKQFTDDELVILRNLPAWANWLARDEDNNLGVYEDKPSKDNGAWKSYGDWEFFSIYRHLFKSIQWTDKEPARIPGR